MVLAFTSDLSKIAIIYLTFMKNYKMNVKIKKLCCGPGNVFSSVDLIKYCGFIFARVTFLSVCEAIRNLSVG